MKKDMIFFGEKGLTATSANDISNRSKEHYQDIETELSNIHFYDKTMSLIGSPEKELMSSGLKTVADVTDKLNKVAKLKSLIAWLREGISAKERLFAEVNNLTFEDCGLVLPEQPKAPERETYLTEDDVVGEWGIKQRNRYYYLETLCAQIGKYIHPNGWFSNARKEMYNLINNPKTTNGVGRDTIVYAYTPSIEPQEVEDKYMELQDSHRSYQAELNGMKHEIEVALEKDKVAKDSAYREKWAAYQKEYDAYSQKLVDLSNQLTVLKNERLEEVQKMKIVIPDGLKGVYEEVNTLGKKKADA